MLLQLLEEQLRDPLMFSEGLHEDQYIFDIHINGALHDEVMKDVVRHGLKHCWAVCEAKEHDKRLEQSSVGFESRLPLVSFYSDIVVAPVNV